MKMHQLIGSALAVGAMAVSAQARIISTFDPGGADAEIREESATSNRGSNSELASRVGATQNSKFYVKLPVGSITTEELANPITYRLTFRHENLPASRIQDLTNFTGADQVTTGLEYYVLDPTHAGADWVESKITYVTNPLDPVNTMGAPGNSFDNNVSTKDYVVGPGQLTPLGTKLFRPFQWIGNEAQENHIPVGEAHDFTFAPGSPLHQAIVAAQGTAHQTITIVAGLQHPNNYSHAAWLGHNYIFNPKEQNPLRTDTSYDNDVAAMDGAEGSPWSGAANTAANPFAPQLLTVPEPSSLALLALAGVAAWRRRR